MIQPVLFMLLIFWHTLTSFLFYFVWILSLSLSRLWFLAADKTPYTSRKRSTDESQPTSSSKKGKSDHESALPQAAAVTDEEARIEASTKAMKVLKDWFPIRIPDRVIKGEFSKWDSENVQQTSVVTCSFSDSHLLNSPLMTLSGILIGNQCLSTVFKLYHHANPAIFSMLI
jgi:hypothetical protein